MIGSLRGTLLERQPTGEVLVEVGGVGYRVLVPPSTLVGLGEVGSTVFMHTHLAVREDALTVYGFASRDQRVCFEALLSAHGVGPALAMAILAVHAPPGLRRAVAEDDVGALCLVPGVGRKTAARLLLELKARLDVPEGDPMDSVAAAHGTNGSGRPSARAEVRDALVALGYGGDEAREAVRDVPDEGDVAVLLRAALARLAPA